MVGYYIHYSILHDFAEQGRIKQLAYFLQVKGYTKSVIYDFNYNKLSKLTNLHWKTCKRYTENLISMGYCEIHGNNLLFKNQIKLLPNDKKAKVIFGIQIKSFSSILNQLYAKVITNNHNQQLYNSGKSKRIKNKKVLRILKKSLLKEIHISSRSIAKLLNVSFVTANKIISDLNKLSYLKTKPKIIEISEMSYSKFLLTKRFDYSKGYLFYKKGIMFRHCGIVVDA